MERGPGPFAGMFQQVADAFADLKGLGEWPRWGSRTALDALFEAVRSGLIGRRIDTEVRGARLVLTLTALDARLDPLGASAGQADDVSLAAADVHYAGARFSTVTATLSNVHTRVGIRPSLVCAPVDLRLSLTNEEAAAILEKYVARVRAICVEPGVVRLRLRRRPRWGWLDVTPEVSGDCVVLQPVAVGWRNRAWRLRCRVPTKAIRTSLPSNARLVGVAVEPRGLTVAVRVDEWRFDYGQVLDAARRRSDEPKR